VHYKKKSKEIGSIRTKQRNTFFLDLDIFPNVFSVFQKTFTGFDRSVHWAIWAMEKFRSNSRVTDGCFMVQGDYNILKMSRATEHNVTICKMQCCGRDATSWYFRGSGAKWLQLDVFAKTIWKSFWRLVFLQTSRLGNCPITPCLRACYSDYKSDKKGKQNGDLGKYDPIHL